MTDFKKFMEQVMAPAPSSEMAIILVNHPSGHSVMIDYGDAPVALASLISHLGRPISVRVTQGTLILRVHDREAPSGIAIYQVMADYAALEPHLKIHAPEYAALASQE